MGGRSGGRVATRPAAERPGRCHTWTTASARPHGVAPRALLDEEQRRAEIIAQTLQSVDVAAPFELSERQLAGTQCALEARAVRLEVDRPLTEVEVHDMMVADDPASPRDPSASKQYRGRGRRLAREPIRELARIIRQAASLGRHRES